MVWLYEPKSHKLLPHLPDDIRALDALGLEIVDNDGREILARKIRVGG